MSETVAFALPGKSKRANQPTIESIVMTSTNTLLDTLGTVAPAFQKYSQDVLNDDLWHRSELSARDRSLVTLAALIARGNTGLFTPYLNHSLDNGVTPTELSELITHMAFYSGWGNALAVVADTQAVFTARNILPADLPAANVELLSIDVAAEEQRAAFVDKTVGPVSPGVVKFTGEVLFHDVWLRPGLAPRDRSLVTVSALIATGKVAQVPYHLNRAMDNGLLQEQAGEVLTHLAFYAGWPDVFSAIPVISAVFEQRAPVTGGR